MLPHAREKGLRITKLHLPFADKLHFDLQLKIGKLLFSLVFLLLFSIFQFSLSIHLFCVASILPTGYLVSGFALILAEN